MAPARRRALLPAGGAYYRATGVAPPFVSRRAFEAVTGPKREVVARADGRWGVVYSLNGRIRPACLLDAGLQAALLAGLAQR